ncbi:uncharacterized protein LOC131662795 isoform X2 [Phymastichus coffea]|nr:uncharacterized protein LOC131662795 isoform X2 [Phymastichus coffea]
MFAEKMTKVFNCKRWIVFNRLEFSMIKPVYNVNRSITSNRQFTKKLLCLNNSHCNSSTRKCYAVLNRLTENSHAHQVMSNLTAYSNCISPKLTVTEDVKIDSVDNLLDKQWISMHNTEILQNFKLLSYYAHQNCEDINHPKYQGVFDILAEKCSKFNKEEMVQFLSLLQFWNTNGLHQNNLFKPLDKACVDNLPNLTIEQVFLICDYIYKLNIVTFSSFIYHAMRKLNPKDMTPANLVQYAFLMKVKGPVSMINMQKFEFCIEKNIDNFSVEELGIICMSFFKYQTAIKSTTLFSKILKKLIADIENVSDITLSSILKILRYSANLSDMRGIDTLIKVLEDQIENKSLLTLTHVALVQATLLIDNSNLLQKIQEKFENEVENARLKDIERFIFSLYIFNCDPEKTSFYKIATEELLSSRRRGEISKFIKPYVYTIMYMLKVNYFPEDIVNKIMAPDFINKFCDNKFSTMDREYLDMSYCLQIDHPRYQGPQLRKDQLNYLLKRFGVLQKQKLQSKKNYKVDAGGKLIIDLTHHIKFTLGSELAIHIDYPLPYNNKQYIFMCYDPVSQCYVPPAEPLSQIPLGEIKYAPKDGKQWIVVVPGSHNILTRNHHLPTGMLAMQLRHLERMGYRTILVTYVIWDQLMTKIQKVDYIRHILGNI